MKRPLLFSSALCLIIGLLCGLILPAPWDQSPSPAQPPNISSPSSQQTVPNSQTSAPPVKNPLPPLNKDDNYVLLNAAYLVANAIKNRDYSSLAAMVHPERGVTFTPYSTVDPETDINFSPNAIKELGSDSSVYTWGAVDGRGNLIEMTAAEYIRQYVYNADYTLAPQIGVDKVLISGNALENVSEAYPDCRFVDFSYSSLDPSMEGMDWCSLKLVFAPGETRWLLVGVIHGQWTI